MPHSGEFEFMMIESEWNVDSVESNKYFPFNSPFMSIIIVENIKQLKKKSKIRSKKPEFQSVWFSKMCFCQIKNNEEYMVLMGILCFIANNVEDHT